MSNQNFYRERKKGIIATIIIHLVFVGILLLAGFTTPLPLPGEEGILINFGDSDVGTGTMDPQITEEIEEQVVTAPPTPVTQEIVEEETITQEYEEAPAIEEKKPEKKVEDKPKIEEKKIDEEKPKEIIEEKVEEVVEKPREVNKKALFPGKATNNSNSNNVGDDENSKGIKGKLEGDPASDNFVGGPSDGSRGISFDLSGRNPEKLPLPVYNFDEEGVVVVEVTVDKNGNVTKVTPGVRGSTTLDAKLLKAAREAALLAKFNVNPNAPAFQKGTITYNFKLK